MDNNRTATKPWKTQRDYTQLAINLGARNSEEAIRRKASLKTLAVAHGCRSVAELIQYIADHRIELERPRRPYK